MLVSTVLSTWSGGVGFRLYGNLKENTPPFCVKHFLAFTFLNIIDSPISSPHLHPMPVLLFIYYYIAH